MKLPDWIELLPPYKGELSDDGRSVTFNLRPRVGIEGTWPAGSCPECYEAGTPGNPLCGLHGHFLTTTGVVLCYPHEHAER